MSYRTSDNVEKLSSFSFLLDDIMDGFHARRYQIAGHLRFSDPSSMIVSLNSLQNSQGQMLITHTGADGLAKCSILKGCGTIQIRRVHDIISQIRRVGHQKRVGLKQGGEWSGGVIPIGMATVWAGL
uniref:Uncharacterized protein n=1 Tax=Oryza punctata TaxID=4537 RepID=A0A0E0KPN3_ORYPU